MVWKSKYQGVLKLWRLCFLKYYWQTLKWREGQPEGLDRWGQMSPRKNWQKKQKQKRKKLKWQVWQKWRQPEVLDSWSQFSKSSIASDVSYFFGQQNLIYCVWIREDYKGNFPKPVTSRPPFITFRKFFVTLFLVRFRTLDNPPPPL